MLNSCGVKEFSKMFEMINGCHTHTHTFTEYEDDKGGCFILCVHKHLLCLGANISFHRWRETAVLCLSVLKGAKSNMLRSHRTGSACLCFSEITVYVCFVMFTRLFSSSEGIRNK